MLECGKINFGFNRCHARKSNTSVIGHKIKGMKEETYFGL